MRVGINISTLASRRTGVQYYTLALVQALARVDIKTDWLLFGACPSLSELPKAENVKLVGGQALVGGQGLLGPRRILWEQLILPSLIARHKVDLLHCPDLSRPLRVPVPVVTTLHDLSYCSSQHFFPLAKRAYKRAMANFAINHSAEIIAVSQFSREEILRHFRLDPARVRVIHNGVYQVSPPARIEGRTPPFLLFVGTLEERKNLVTLINAFTQLRTAGRIPHRLILVGQPGWGANKIHAAIRASSCADAIEVRGYVPQEEVLDLYAASDAFVYPSVYEGFGLPVLEAMACGTPVVCSRAASLPEVAGDAAEFFEPASVEDLVGAIERVVVSPNARADLRRRGLERVSHFSWEECARQHRQLYGDVLQHERSRHPGPRSKR
jgi:glycosyltransferase involved in cell wall biosynthesis